MTPQHAPVDRNSERGIAIVVALFMTLVMSLLGVSLMFMSQSETWNSANYRLASQARYAAESGVQRAVNFLLDSTAYTPPDTAAMANYDTTVSPVRLIANNNPVILSSDASTTATYPVSGIQTSFSNSVKGQLSLGNAPTTYVASAKLLSMRQFTPPYSTQPKTIQTWEVTGTGNILGPRSSKVQVSGILGQYLIPLYSYAAFATATGCGALTFGGGAITDSYDSSTYDPLNPSTLAASLQNSNGNLGSNGNLTELGDSTMINGSLSTPRVGVGNCSSTSVTALTTQDADHVTGGLIELSQARIYPPPTLSATPPTSGSSTFNSVGTSCPTGVSGATCAKTTVGGITVWTVTPLTPTTVVTMANVTVGANTTLHLNTGTYAVNTLTVVSASATLEVSDNNPVTVQVQGTTTQPTAIDFTGGSLSNPSLDPSNLQITYAGTKQVKLTGGATSSALVYAPNASTSFYGASTDFYGSVITKTVTDMGGIELHYDRNLEKFLKTASEPMLSSFSWKSF